MKPRRRLCESSNGYLYVDRGTFQPMIRRARLGEIGTCQACGRDFATPASACAPAHFVSEVSA